MKDIKLCHPQLQIKAARLLEACEKQGLKIKIGETLRTRDEQDALYAQGRTKPGSIVTNAPGSSYSSYHQWGTAFDIYRNDGKGAYDESGDFFTRVGQIGKSVGLEWGGDWKSIVDKPHFQLPDWGSSTAGIKKKYGTPDVFMKTWIPVQPGGAGAVWETKGRWKSGRRNKKKVTDRGIIQTEESGRRESCRRSMKKYYCRSCLLTLMIHKKCVESLASL